MKRGPRHKVGALFAHRADPQPKKPLPGDGERLSDWAGERGQKLTFAPTNQLRGSDGP